MIFIGQKKHLDQTLIGQKFGKLTIIDFTTVERGRQKCVCKCECGNTTLAFFNELNNGHKKSCGCLKTNAIEKYKYLIGQKINKWMILDIKHTGKICKAICKCECGTIKEINIYNLLNNSSKDCGCSRKKMLSDTRTKDLTMQRFGKLVAVELLEQSNKFNRRLYRCKCDCGNEVIVPSINLINGHTNSCGCLTSFANAYINELLSNLKIKFKPEYCVNIEGHNLRFDFYLKDYNMMIEYDGKQHYYPVNFGKWSDEELMSNFEKTQKYDQLKNEYCKQNNIYLLRIPYWEKENIKEIINNHLQRLSRKDFVA